MQGSRAGRPLTELLETLAERLTGGSLAPIMTRLVEQKRISHSEIERLRRILDEETEAQFDARFSEIVGA